MAIIKILIVTVLGGVTLFGILDRSAAEVTIAGKKPLAFLQKINAPFQKDQTEEYRTILVLGEAGRGWTAGDLTDTVLIVVLDGPRQRATLLSIPRDLLVQLPDGTTSKINALWTIGKKGSANIHDASALIREAVENVTGLAISDVLVVDIAATERAIDALGGIALNVTERITDPAFPTPGGGIEQFTIESGFQVLDGKTAVKYARTRHTENGDFGRVRRQQQVLEALVAKTRGLKLAEDAPAILALSKSFLEAVETTLTITDVPKLVALANSISFSNVRTFSLETLGSKPLLANTGASALIPVSRPFEYGEIRAAVNELIQ